MAAVDVLRTVIPFTDRANGERTNVRITIAFYVSGKAATCTKLKSLRGSLDRVICGDVGAVVVEMTI
jgi:hypothetical protein